VSSFQTIIDTIGARTVHGFTSNNEAVPLPCSYVNHNQNSVSKES